MIGGTSWVSRSRAIWIAAAVAALVFAGSLRNEWAFDDPPIVLENDNVKSIGAALEAFFSPYWPPEHGAGQYRPGTILSFAVDWQLAPGNAVVFHGTNVLLHAVATALFVLVILRWLPPAGSLIAGVVFAVHPVHVEAVANVVGRSEVLVAVLLFGAILAARRFRASAPESWARSGWMFLTIACSLAAMLAKEHGIVAIALLGLDQMLDDPGAFRRSVPMYVGVATVSLAWIFVFRHVAGAYVEGAEAATVRGLSTWERLSTVFPVQLHAVRLLVWPFDLAADYNPQLIPRLTSWSWTATLGLLMVGSVFLLSLLIVRSAPVITFGIWLAIITYSPTSNLFFASGVILAERNLYMAAGVTAVLAGWLSLGRPPREGRLVLAALGLVVGAFTVQTISRVPAWRDTRTVVIEDFLNHPENYRARVRLSSVLRDSGRPAEALAEAMAAAAIFPEDPFLAVTTVTRAMTMGFPSIVAREAERAYALEPDRPVLARLVTRARLINGDFGGAVRAARRAVVVAPGDTVAAGIYAEVTDSLTAPRWIRELAWARVAWGTGHLIEASDRLLDAREALPERIDAEGDCWDLRTADAVWSALRPGGADHARRVLAASPSCRAETNPNFRPDAGN